ncbi:uncharacterized protein [Haliotis asinina]|uniref:uncharacterized protein n=1 Tax=Haliotis asinina TaxID=109174 RepID=UPI00353219A5
MDSLPGDEIPNEETSKSRGFEETVDMDSLPGDEIPNEETSKSRGFEETVDMDSLPGDEIPNEETSKSRGFEETVDMDSLPGDEIPNEETLKSRGFEETVDMDSLPGDEIPNEETLKPRGFEEMVDVVSLPGDEIPNKETEFRCCICEKVLKSKSGYTVHQQMHLKSKGAYRKPERRCPFCNISQTRLSRHIALQHKDIAEVAEALKFEKNSKERNMLFDNFRKRGIFEFNKTQALEDEPAFVSERRGQKDLVCCTSCKGFYSRQLYYRHKATCMKDSAILPSSVSTDALQLEERATANQDIFIKEVLLHFHSDDVGKTCRTEPTIVAIGRRLFQKNLRKIEKTMETRKSVMNDMRLLSRLLIAFQEKSHKQMTAEDMFRRRNFAILEQAIEEVTTNEGRLKYGLKNSLFYLLRQSANILMLQAFGEEEDGRASDIEKFIHLLDLNQNVLFGDAAYSINKSRQERLRMPEQHAKEEEVTKLRNHTLSVIKRLMSEYEIIGRNEYVTLRDSVCCRITLFNARRGGEPSRLKISNLEDAFANRWIDDSRIEQLEPWEKELFSEMLVAYQTGKGNHLVPVLIPRDCVSALSILTDKDKRKEVGILEGNPYVFPNTQQSTFHVLGWDAIRSMCDAAGVKHPELLTASKQRRRISTIYASLEVPTSEREYFYKHMGHSKGVNEGVYQYPLPIQEVTKVGKHLLHIDQGDAPSMSQPTTRNIDMAAVECEESVEESGSKSHSKEQEDVTKRFKWTEASTRLVREEFAEWICLPSGSSLPKKETVLAFLQISKLECSYVQLRTKIMNEQRKQQERTRKRWQAFRE